MPRKAPTSGGQDDVQIQRPKAIGKKPTQTADRAGARFVSKDGRIGLTFALAPVDGDRVVDADVIKVYVAAEIAAALDESIIDARDDDGKTSLIMRKQAEAKAKVAKSVH